MDRRPKKQCKFCRKDSPDHFPYGCRLNPKVIARQKAGMKRSPIKKIGKRTQEWLDARSQWILDNPPPIEGIYWLCYLQVHPWCPVRLTRDILTLDHVVPRSRDQSRRLDFDNLRPACEYCNSLKGSRTLEQMNRDLYNSFVQSNETKS